MRTSAEALPVFILDDHPSVREGIRAILDGSGRYRVAGLEGEALRNLLANAVRLSSARTGLERSRYDGLTPREKDVFRLTALNKSVKDSAEELALSPKTVENVKSAIFGKLAIQDRLELYKYAVRIGVIEEED